MVSPNQLLLKLHERSQGNSSTEVGHDVMHSDGVCEDVGILIGFLVYLVPSLGMVSGVMVDI